MFVQADTDPPPPNRAHPWGAATSNPSLKYYNFKAQPELIQQVLEDFKPWEHYTAIPTFYDLLRWLNGPNSVFETNDCGLRPPKIDPAPPALIRFSAPTVMHGRLSVLFRDLIHNTRSESIEWLQKGILGWLKDGVPNWPVCVFVGPWPHVFIDIGKPGNTLQLRYWAWGENEAEAMQFLDALYRALTACFKSASASIRAQQQALASAQPGGVPP